MSERQFHIPLGDYTSAAWSSQKRWLSQGCGVCSGRGE